METVVVLGGKGKGVGKGCWESGVTCDGSYEDVNHFDKGTCWTQK